jgi:hypothetical protein
MQVMQIIPHEEGNAAFSFGVERLTLFIPAWKPQDLHSKKRRRAIANRWGLATNNNKAGMLCYAGKSREIGNIDTAAQL